MRLLSTIVALGALAACTPAPTPLPAPELPSEFDPEIPDTSSVLTPEEVAVGASALIDELVQLPPREIFDVFAQFQAMSEEPIVDVEGRCPEYARADCRLDWESDRCFTEGDLALFDGKMKSELTLDPFCMSASDAQNKDFFLRKSIDGSAHIADLSGNLEDFLSTGSSFYEISRTRSEPLESRRILFRLNGAVTWSPKEDIDDGLSWLNEGRFASNFQSSSLNNPIANPSASVSKNLKLRGGLSGFHGLFTAVNFSQSGFTLTDPENPASGFSGDFQTFRLTKYINTCEIDVRTGLPAHEEPLGSMVLRDVNGTWYELVFDGPISTSTACGDGCATLRINGVATEQEVKVCNIESLSKLFSWGEGLWEP